MDLRPSGWYDDPDSPDQLRYWDGVVWTEHVASKRPTPSAGSSGTYGTQGGHGSSGPISEPAAGSSAQQWAEYQARQAFGEHRGERTGSSAGFGRDARRRDGTVLAGWWRRVGAFYLDTILVSLVCLPLTWSRYQSLSAQLDQLVEQFANAAATGAVAPQIPPEMMSDASFIGVVQTVAYILFEVFFLTRRGVTPGRFVTRIRVRRVDADEPLDLATASRRTIVKNVSNLLGGVPLVSFFASVFQIVDFGFPLWDKRRQAIHDKAATSEVVRLERTTPQDQGPAT